MPSISTLRWHNYYVEGLDWLARNVEIDGIYLDDLGFGRELMLRMRRVLARRRPRPVIDLHSANQYNERDGFASAWFANIFGVDAITAAALRSASATSPSVRSNGP